MNAKLEIGTKLYVFPEHHVFVFPTEEMVVAAAAAMAPATATGEAAHSYTIWWSKKLNCHVSWIYGGSPWMVVEIGRESKVVNDFRLVQVLTVDGGKLGWINVASWMKIEELRG